MTSDGQGRDSRVNKQDNTNRRVLGVIYILFTLMFFILKSILSNINIAILAFTFSFSF